MMAKTIAFIFFITINTLCFGQKPVVRMNFDNKGLLENGTMEIITISHYIHEDMSGKYFSTNWILVRIWLPFMQIMLDVHAMFANRLMYFGVIPPS